MQSQWNGEREKIRLRRMGAKKMLAVANRLAKQHEIDIGRQYPPASRPGEFPARRNGNLQRSIRVAPAVVDQVMATEIVQVSYDPAVAPYAGFLKAMGRLSIADTKDRIRPQLESGFRLEVAE